MPIIPILWVAGIVAGGYALNKTEDSLLAANKLTKTAAVAGAVYLAYKWTTKK